MFERIKELIVSQNRRPCQKSLETESAGYLVLNGATNVTSVLNFLSANRKSYTLVFVSSLVRVFVCTDKVQVYFSIVVNVNTFLWDD